MVTGHFRAMVGPLMEVGKERVEGDNHEVAHSVGTGEPLVGQ